MAVGLATYEATAVVFDYQELEPATLKQDMLANRGEPVKLSQEAPIEEAIEAPSEAPEEESTSE